MTIAQVVEISVTVNNNSPIQDYVHPDDQTQPTFEIFSLLSSRNFVTMATSRNDFSSLFNEIEKFNPKLM